MIRDALDRTTKDEVLKADICIIGAGAAGLSMAHNLIGSGKSVVVLESSRYNDCQIVTKEQTHRFEDPAVQPLYAGTMVNPSPGKNADEFFNRSRVRCYGGTTNGWKGSTRPLLADDFMRDIRWPPEVEKDLRRTFYQKAMSYCSIGAWEVANYDNDQKQYDLWINQAKSQLDVVPFKADADLQTAVVLTIGENFKEGRTDGAWDFQLRWGRDIELSNNVTIYRNANVRKLSLNKNMWNKIDQVEATTVTRDDYNRPVAGHDFYVEAKRYVLAASCIENTRLLLHSGFKTTTFETLGRYLMTHPRLTKAATFRMKEVPNPRIQAFYNNATTIWGRQDNYHPTIRAMLVPKSTTSQRENIGNFRAMMLFNSAAGTDGSVDLSWEQLPDSGNKIELGDTMDPIFGDPVAKVTLDLTEKDRKTRDVALRLVEQMLKSTGYGENFQVTKDAAVLSGEDAMGTTRIRQAGPYAGVVDSDCCVHDVNNLYIAGSSVFPTGGWAAPGLTIVALALRLSDYLKGLH